MNLTECQRRALLALSTGGLVRGVGWANTIRALRRRGLIMKKRGRWCLTASGLSIIQ